MPMTLLLGEESERDDRSPLLVLSLGESSSASSIAFYGFDPRFWATSFLLLAVQNAVNCIFAMVIYYAVVREREQRQQRRQAAGISPYLVGYGFVIPLLLLWPCWLIEWLDLRNIAFILCAGGNGPAMLLFRCIEAMHGTLPPYLMTSTDNYDDKDENKDKNKTEEATKTTTNNNKNEESSPSGGGNHASLTQFMIYYASAIQLELDPVTGAPIPFNVYKHGPPKFLRFVSVFLQTSLCYGLLLSFDYQVFPSRRGEGLLDFFYWGNILNNFLMASLTSLCLESGASGLGLLTSCVTGMTTIEFSDSPLTKSKSPSDFWGRRWNRLTGPALRRGVYQPLRKCLQLNTHVCAALTFLASGLLHEYILYLLSLRRGKPNTPLLRYNDNNGNSDDLGASFVPNHGNQFVFFCWCGATLLTERLLGPYFSCWFPLKGPIRTALVLLTTLPVAHLMTDEWVAASYYNDISLGFPKYIVKTKTA